MRGEKQRASCAPINDKRQQISNMVMDTLGPGCLTGGWERGHHVPSMSDPPGALSLLLKELVESAVAHSWGSKCDRAHLLS